MSPETALHEVNSILDSAQYDDCLGIKFKTPGIYKYNGEEFELDDYDRKKLRENVEKYIKIYLNNLGCCDADS